MNWVKLGIFAGGVAFGSVGLKLLGSKDAKKVYAQVTAATLRAKDAKNAVIEDECDCDCGCEAVSEEA